MAQTIEIRIEVVELFSILNFTLSIADCGDSHGTGIIITAALGQPAAKAAAWQPAGARSDHRGRAVLRRPLPVDDFDRAEGRHRLGPATIPLDPTRQSTGRLSGPAGAAVYARVRRSNRALRVAAQRQRRRHVCKPRQPGPDLRFATERAPR